jgi:hypothetical protein
LSWQVVEFAIQINGAKGAKTRLPHEIPWFAEAALQQEEIAATLRTPKREELRNHRSEKPEEPEESNPVMLSSAADYDEQEGGSCADKNDAFGATEFFANRHGW